MMMLIGVVRGKMMMVGGVLTSSIRRR